ncbi:MAG: hypothetical protein KDC93_01415 [Cyclobacteriaceae bacterium]|jgi:hypothetical protein|nr:hypothetical protein [Cyclobacteriaceae bacterium]
MAFLDTLFGKKKKVFKASCIITKEPLEKGYGYLLTTSQVVKSKKYWDMIMTEPETMSYTVSHFQNDAMGTQMRSMIFDKYATIDKPWIVSDSIINYFDVDKSKAREYAQKWWENEGNFEPAETGPATDHLDAATFKALESYAIQEAGKDKLPV